jgi:DNA-directed RNA polymerase specialized sigma24 family protein
MRIIINASKARLSDEEIDPIEQDDFESASNFQTEGWLPWDEDDLIDIQRIINERMSPQQKEVIDAFLGGKTYKELGVTEKYWRYHYEKAIEFIKKEMKL